MTEVNLQDVLTASAYLEELGGCYESSIRRLSEAVEGADSVFEEGSLFESWTNLGNDAWTALADSQDNLYDTSLALLRYVNAVCEADDNAAQELKDEIKDYNTALENTEDGGNGLSDELELRDPLPEPDLDNKDQMFEEPGNDKATRPEGTD